MISFLKACFSTYPQQQSARSAELSNTNSPDKTGLGHYLAGLIEGDGSFYVPTTPRDSKGRKLVPHIEIEFDIRDLPLAEKLLEVLGGGFLSRRATSQSCRLTIRDQRTYLFVINLINGHMRTPKIEALNRAIIWLNTYRLSNNHLSLKPLDTTPLSSNSWLSGFMDADCSFYFDWKLGKKGLPNAPIYYMNLSQKQEYLRESNFGSSFLPIMENIAQFFLTDVKIIDRQKQTYRELGYYIRTDKIESKTILFDYLTEYPLFSYKHYTVLSLRKVHDLVLTKGYKTANGNDLLTGLKENMKYDPTVHNGSHLTYFYNT